MKVLSKNNLLISGVVLSLTALQVSCGDDSEDSSDSVSSFLSTIDFAVPSSLSITTTALSLQGETDESADTTMGPSSDTPRGKKRPSPKQSEPVSSDVDIINLRADQMSKVVERLNEVLARLQEDSVEGEGTFSGKGPDELISGQVQALADDADYSYEAAICYDSVQFMYLKFNDDGSKIHAIRDFAAAPMGRDDSINMLSSVTFSSDADAGTSQLELRSYGSPWNRSSNDSTSYMVEYSLGTVDADGNFWLKSVVDNFDDEPETFAGDAYLLGTVAADASGYSIGYHGSNTDCSSTVFDEAAETPEFCVGKAIDSDVAYTAEEREAAWANLSTYGLATSSNLETIVMNSDLACE